MHAQVKKIIDYMEELAPATNALPGDPVGLQLGNPEAEVRKILVALDPDQTALEEAAEIGAEMIVSHHPLFYNQLTSINENHPTGFLVTSAIKQGLNIYSAHTNYDAAPNGVSYQLARALGFQADQATVLEATGSEHFLKLVVFIPTGYEDRVRSALAEAGAGQIGGYSHCTFQLSGTGTFMPHQGTTPFIGSQGRMEKVDEIRLETILPFSNQDKVIGALVEAHPYEEVAYDLYPLVLEGSQVGLGLSFSLDEPLSLEQLIDKCRHSLQAGSLRYWTAGKNNYSRVALCGGSGGSLIAKAAGQQAEIFISGDFSYHDLKHAQSLRLALIDAGHDATEWPGVFYLKSYLTERLKADHYETEVCLQTSVLTGWID